MTEKLFYGDHIPLNKQINYLGLIKMFVWLTLDKPLTYLHAQETFFGIILLLLWMLDTVKIKWNVFNSFKPGVPFMGHRQTE